jgi:hypothetical protein
VHLVEIVAQQAGFYAPPCLAYAEDDQVNKIYERPVQENV